MSHKHWSQFWLLLGLLITCPSILYSQKDHTERMSIGIDELKGIAIPRPGVMIVAYERGVMRTEDSGTTWTMYNFPDCRGVSDMQFRGNLGILAETRRIWRSTDTGKSWNCMYRGEGMWGRGSDLNLCVVEFVDSNVLIATGTLNSAIRSTDGGVTWTPIEHLTGFSLMGVGFYDGWQGIIITTSGDVNRSTDGGATWKDTACTFQGYDRLFDPGLSGIVYLGRDTCIAISGSGDIFRSIDNGVNWQRTWKDPSNNSLEDVEFVDPLHGVVVGTSGVIRYTTDGGKTWEWDLYENGSDLYKVHFLSHNEVVIIGEQGRIIRKTFDW